MEIKLIHVQPSDVLILSIVVLFLGMWLNRKIQFFRDNYLPPAVTGGICCSVVLALVRHFTGYQMEFDMQLRDLLLLIFFSTVGLSARLGTLGSGGKALGILVVIAGAFLVLQDLTGIALAKAFGAHPGYGLMAGSVSFAGGHGTAIAWGGEAEAAGLAGAGEIGIVFATFGLIAGGLIGGPLAKRLISKYDLKSTEQEEQKSASEMAEEPTAAARRFWILGAILVLAICVEVGDVVNRIFFEKDILLPGFLTSMLVGIILGNLFDVLKVRMNRSTIDIFGDVSLNIFLAMSLMSMQLWALGGAVVPILMVLILQTLLMSVFAVHVVFRAMGKDYDACVIATGFAGLGLGATPVAIANMSAITSRFGASAKAFLVIPLVGAFFIDLLNAATIKFFIGTFG